MQGLVTLDFGNSRPHAGIFKKENGTWRMEEVVPFSGLSSRLKDAQMNAHDTSLVLCEVRSREEELFPYLQQGYLLTRLKDYWRGEKFSGMPVHYAKTLGEDRLIQAHYLFKQKQVPSLLIDAGTFTTLDVITERGFMGGYIVPGRSLYQSTFQKGELLKSVDLDQDNSSELPHETAHAMRDGYRAFASLSRDIIHQHGSQRVVLTGGDALLWKKLFDDLKLGVLVEVKPHLIHFALHHWWTTQIEPL